MRPFGSNPVPATNRPVNPALLRTADKKALWVAVYIIWVKGDTGAMIGTTRSARDIPSTAARFNQHEIVTRLVWFDTQSSAETVMKAFRLRSKHLFSHHTWYREVRGEDAEKTIRGLAHDLGLHVYSSEEREKVLLDAVTYGVSKLRPAAVVAQPQSAPAQVAQASDWFKLKRWG